MQKINYTGYFTVLLVTALINFSGCNKPIYDFGYDGVLSGKIMDANGNAISGDMKLVTYSVHALGEMDLTPMVIRIKGDGTYINSKLFPQSYKVTLRGPFIESVTDTMVIDLAEGKIVTKDYQVTPFLTIPKPVISGNPTSTDVTVSYSITGNVGRTPNLREIYVSTVSWPTRTTGSGNGWVTISRTVTANQGDVTISGLKPQTLYYVRIGARAAGQSLFNHSEQISFTTPAK